MPTSMVPGKGLGIPCAKIGMNPHGIFTIKLISN